MRREKKVAPCDIYFSEVSALQKWKRLVLALGIVAAAGVLLLHPKTTAAAVAQGLQICARSVLPALFPFFIVTDLWIRLGFPQTLGRIAGPAVERVLHLPGSVASVLLLGILGGYPVGARSVAALKEQGAISKEDAEAALRICNNAGPAFLFGIAGNLIGGARQALLLWGIHLSAALLIGLLLRPPVPPRTGTASVSQPPEAFLPALTEAVTQGSQTALQVCGFVLFFSILIGFFPASSGNSVWGTAILGSLELAGGFSLLGQLTMPWETRFVVSAALLGWGGLCVHCQSLAAIYRAGLSGRSYLVGKLLHGLVSMALACLVAPRCDPVSGFSSPAPPLLVPAISVLLAWAIVLVLKTSSGKQRIRSV